MARVRFKASDIWDAPDDGKIYEVIDGDLYVTPAPAWRHQRGVGKLYVLLATFVWERGRGEITPAPTGVVLDEETGVEPDIVFVSSDRADIISDRGVEGPPDLVVEALSPSTEARDRGIKMRRYAAAGIPHYWLLNVEAHVLEPYRLGEGGYELVGVFGPGSTFEPELFPGFVISIDALFA